MKNSRLWKKVRYAFNELHLADKCLLIFVVILMVQLTHNLFFHELAMQESNSFNVIVRTTLAAIFGYFISANFQNGGRDISEDEHMDNNGVVTAFTSSNSDSKAKGKIDFSFGSEFNELQSGYAGNNDNNQPEQRNYLQILIVAGIGLSSLLLLIIAYNYFPTSNMAIATVSQLRDFVSGSVGFLIGHSTHSKKSD